MPRISIVTTPPWTHRHPVAEHPQPRACPEPLEVSVPASRRSARSAFDGVEVAFDAVCSEDDELVDEVEAAAADVRFGVLGVQP